MYSDDELAVPKNQGAFWSMAEANFEHARHVLEDYPAQSRDEALAGHRRAMEVIAFRNVDDGYDQRDHFLHMGRELLPQVRALMDRRELSPEFAQEWGKLMYCHGFIASYVFDDSDDLATQRGNARSAAVRSNKLHKQWLAHIFQRPEFAALKREVADEQVGRFLARLRANPQSAALYPKGWFDKLLTGRGDLRSARR
ncbi:MAG: hypothetical protein EON59_03585 [Alphaproteobacteria bacterium]|nr:MAG: hypothetical protein EON59_03585 [Alphaproteobacteria bacterium]